MRRMISDLLTLSGLLLLLMVSAIWIRSRLAFEQPTDQRYLLSSVRIGVPLPASASIPESAKSQTSEAEKSQTSPGIDTTPSPVIRISIPRIAVDQSVVPVGLRVGKNGRTEWDTEAIFATDYRRDLVGQLTTSLNPGEGGNIILIGHNYDRGRLLWEGVFLHLGELSPGNRITLYTQSGNSHEYIVQQVVSVPSNDPARHEKYLWPTENEQLTLVTCGGPNFGRWSVRVYAIAVPINR